MLETNAVWWVAGGGAIGAYLRYQFSAWFTDWLGKGFPYGTLFVNVLGSFIMGMLAGAMQAGTMAVNPWHDFLQEGMMGALTTFSTFSMDTFKLYYGGQTGKGTWNLILNMVLSVGGLALGYYIMAR